MSKLDHLNVFLTDWFSETLEFNAVFNQAMVAEWLKELIPYSSLESPVCLEFEPAQGRNYSAFWMEGLVGRSINCGFSDLWKNIFRFGTRTCHL